VHRTAIANLTTPGSDRGDPGWLLECELEDDAGAPSDTLRALLTDMRLVGFHPLLFTAQPSTDVRNAGALSVSTDA
jgi:hypothetical protein